VGNENDEARASYDRRAMMRKLSQEFFWTPGEMVAWLKHVNEDFDLWLVLWEAGADARLVASEELSPDFFEGVTDDSVQMFIGDSRLSLPAWRNANGRRLLDLQRSCAVQLVPPILSRGRHLLQGRLATLRPQVYEVSCAGGVPQLFQQLCRSMKRNSDHTRVVTQLLPDGRKKRWTDILVGKGVPAEDVRLKQFAAGAVVFDLETA
jgi:hypothetical protein